MSLEALGVLLGNREGKRIKVDISSRVDDGVIAVLLTKLLNGREDSSHMIENDKKMLRVALVYLFE